MPHASPAPGPSPAPEDGLYRTELTYDPAVKILSFPLQSGATFTANARNAPKDSLAPVLQDCAA